jgi:redox-sensitive bicupin YhaK (pirin superfamily)
MSNIDLIIEERAASIGPFMVGRLLPFRQKRMVGPFIYIDHMGPVELPADENFDVPPHPHIGLSTLTFLMEGHIMHRDTLGTVQEITPGAVNWMTAGKGIVHSERTPDSLREKPVRMHGLQIWVALPKDLEEIEPNFTHVEKADLPSWSENGLDFRLVAGEALGKKSPVPVYSKLYMIEIKNGPERRALHLENKLYGEAGLYILEGSVFAQGNEYASRQILVSNDGSLCALELAPNTTLYIFGGEPFPEERHIHWNFVSSRLERIEEAREQWKNQEFGTIEGETDYIPLPELPRGLRSKS